MFGKLLMLFIAVPIAELYLLVAVGEKIGMFNTIGLVVLTGFVGAAFARSQGGQVLRNIQRTWGRGEIPGEDLMQGALIVAGGIMLITPGIITDLVGLSLIFPLTRIFYARIALAWFKKKMKSGQFTFSAGSSAGGMHFHPDNGADDDGEYSEPYGVRQVIDVTPDQEE